MLRENLELSFYDLYLSKYFILRPISLTLFFIISITFVVRSILNNSSLPMMCIVFLEHHHVSMSHAL